MDAGIHPGDYDVIRKQNHAEIGDSIVAQDQGVNNLKMLAYNQKRARYFLRSCNEDRECYADIYPDELQIPEISTTYYTNEAAEREFRGYLFSYRRIPPRFWSTRKAAAWIGTPA